MTRTHFPQPLHRYSAQLVMMFVAGLQVACTAPQASPAAPVKPPAMQVAPVVVPAPPAPMPVQAVPAAVLDANAYWLPALGQVVSIQGSYEGWANCEESGQLTKGDWVLRYSAVGATVADGAGSGNKAPRSACVFVAGGVPSGITAPPSKVSVGMPVFIKAKVELSPQGRVYLMRQP